jgi:hypothetical protein
MQIALTFIIAALFIVACLAQDGSQATGNSLGTQDYPDSQKPSRGNSVNSGTLGRSDSVVSRPLPPRRRVKVKRKKPAEPTKPVTTIRQEQEQQDAVEAVNHALGKRKRDPNHWSMQKKQ